MELPCAAGAPGLFGALYRPPAEGGFGPGPLPLVVAVYGGPHVQRVRREWALTADMRAQRLASAGFLVLKLDNRGSARRGLRFEGALHHAMGTVEVEDQVRAETSARASELSLSNLSLSAAVKLERGAPPPPTPPHPHPHPHPHCA